MRWVSGLLFSAVLSLPAQSAAACDIALILAVDVSGSVDQNEYDIQMKGLAEALRDGAISEALVVREAAVQVIQWTGSGRHRVLIVGPGAFAMRAAEFEDYPERIRHKLLREITKQLSEVVVPRDSGNL